MNQSLLKNTVQIGLALGVGNISILAPIYANPALFKQNRRAFALRRERL